MRGGFLKSIQQQGKVLKKTLTNDKKLDQREEDRRELLSACSRLDEETVVEGCKKEQVRGLPYMTSAQRGGGQKIP